MDNSTNFKISFNRAVEYVSDYVEHFKLKENANTPMNSIGGIIRTGLIRTRRENIKRIRNFQFEKNARMEMLDSNRTYQGLMAWFCWGEEISDEKDPSKNFPEHYFLSFEINDQTELSRHGSTLIPDMESLTRPFDIIQWDKNSNREDIEKMLSNPEDVCSRFNNKIMRGISNEFGCRRLIRQFKQKIVGREDSNVLIPFGLFENECSSDVDEFLDMDGIEYIRYYFGYDKTAEFNKIRIILFGVDKDWQNMIPNNKTEVLVEDPIILQKSWPPPVGGGGITE